LTMMKKNAFFSSSSRETRGREKRVSCCWQCAKN
jgi:hypothetical protein